MPKIKAGPINGSNNVRSLGPGLGLILSSEDAEGTGVAVEESRAAHWANLTIAEKSAHRD